MKRSKIYLVTLVLLMFSVTPIWSSSSATFALYRGASTPSGAGYVYYERNAADNLKQSIGDENWVEVTGSGNANALTEGVKIDVDDSNNLPDGIVDKSTGALYMYFYAKENPGYRFRGWKEQVGNGSLSGDYLEGETAIYYTPQEYNNSNKKKYGKKADWTGNGGVTSGYYSSGGYYYLRHVLQVPNNSTKSYKMHAYFEYLSNLLCKQVLSRRIRLRPVRHLIILYLPQLAM